MNVLLKGLTASLEQFDGRVMRFGLYGSVDLIEGKYIKTCHQQWQDRTWFNIMSVQCLREMKLNSRFEGASARAKRRRLLFRGA